MTARDRLIQVLAYRARREGAGAVDRWFVWETMENADVGRMGRRAGYGEDMTERQAAGLVRDINRKLSGAVPC